jgi:hypothetical protein
MRVLVRVILEIHPIFDRPIDFLGWHSRLFHKAVRKNCGNVPVKEVEHPIIHALKPHSELVNAVPQIVSASGLLSS